MGEIYFQWGNIFLRVCCPHRGDIFPIGGVYSPWGGSEYIHHKGVYSPIGTRKKQVFTFSRRLLIKGKTALGISERRKNEEEEAEEK